MELRKRPGFLYMDLDDFEEYLADKPEHEKWELIGGRVVKMMVGARWTHHRLVQNVTVYLTNHFRQRGSPCRTFTETFWLKERFLRLAVFPDVMVHCGPVDREAASLNDPVVLFEVVSPGSERRDRIDKGALYPRLPSLQHYVLVERDTVAIDVLSRVDERNWTGPQRVEGLDAVLSLPAVEVEIPPREIYRDVIEAE